MTAQATAAVPKGFRRGTHRLIDPAETVDKVRRVMPALGITRVANVTGLDTVGIPVVMVCRPNSRSLSVSQGKGLDLDAARASGLMESVELFHAERILLPLKLATFEELRAEHRVVDVEALPRLSVSVFHPHLRLLWIEAEDVLQGTSVWVPYEMVHMDYTLPFPPGSGCFAMSSNGLAAGNHLLEALIHALCEVVERDADTLWYHRSKAAQGRTRLDLGTVDDPLCLEVLEKYERAEVRVAVWEITTDVGIPAFRSVILDRRPNPWRPLYANHGMGCHPAREIALLRALTEAAQGRLTMISSARDDVGRDAYAHFQDPEVHERVRVELDAQTPLRSFLDAPTRQHRSFGEDLAWVLERLRAAGFGTAAAVDLTRPGLELPVVRAIIPGLEPPHESSGYVPGPRVRRVLRNREESP